MQGKVIMSNSLYNSTTGSIFILRLRRLGRRRFIVSILSTHAPIFRERFYTTMGEAHTKYIKVTMKVEARNVRQNKT